MIHGLFFSWTSVIITRLKEKLLEAPQDSPAHNKSFFKTQFFLACTMCFYCLLLSLPPPAVSTLAVDANRKLTCALSSSVTELRSAQIGKSITNHTPKSLRNTHTYTLAHTHKHTHMLTHSHTHTGAQTEWIHVTDTSAQPRAHTD